MTLAEASAMQFVSRHTSIPVPKVYSAFTHKGRTYIVMERIDGQMLAWGWLLRPDEERRRILDQLKAMIKELRNIDPPEGVGIGVSNVDGGPIYDNRLPRQPFWGPFKTIEDFHNEFWSGVPMSDPLNNFSSELQELLAFHQKPWPKSVFTHGDLSSFNILARGDKVVGIVDWETAGWLPPYWEYARA